MLSEEPESSGRIVRADYVIIIICIEKDLRAIHGAVFI
jgi:hypothetical protein